MTSPAPKSLMTSARKSAKFRGHNMKPFRRHPHREAWSCSCRDCGMEMTVKAKPAPNEIDIGGEAVALNCSKRSTMRG